MPRGARKSRSSPCPLPTNGFTMFCQARPSTPKLSAVSSRDLVKITAGSLSSGWATDAGGEIHSNPWSAKGNARQNGDKIPIGCTAEQKSCLKPGKVNSWVRVPPPIVSAASTTNTLAPLRASSIAAESPLGPEPIIIASYFI